MNNYKKTDKLLDILKKSPTVDDYIENENDNLVNMTLSEYLNKILSDRNLKTSDLVKLTGLDRTYTYQIMSGRKIRPEIKLSPYVLHLICHLKIPSSF